MRAQAMVHRYRVVALLVIVVSGALVLSACGGGGQAQPTSPTTPRTGLESRSGPLAPDYEIAVYQSADVLGGEQVRFSALLGQGRPVVLNFWAGLCPPCRVEMPDLQEVHEQYRDRILLFGLDVGPFLALGSREDGKALLEELKVTYPTGTTFDPQVVRAYQVTGMPSTYFIKPNGEIIGKWTGLLTRDKLAKRVEELLAASS